MKIKSILFTASLGLSFAAGAFNSEEHKLIGDSGVARVQIPDAIAKRLPNSVKMHQTDRSEYQQFIKSAKLLAVGFDTNDEADFDKNRRGVQDNCYWKTFRQLNHNKHIWIPPLTDIPKRHMTLASNVSSKASDFTFGELVAFYADYRRTIHCDDSGKCYLTPKDIDEIKFERGDITNNIRNFCPQPIAADTYLRYISSGIVPPHGRAGNVVANSANNDEVHEAAWWGDEMLRMTVAGDNHFASTAIAHYVGMHRMALHFVDKARKEPKYWNVALHYQAGALHSLTDLFAFGHDVTHRDITSREILRGRELESHPTTLWLEQVFKNGGGERTWNGQAYFKYPFSPIKIPKQARNDFMPTVTTLTHLDLENREALGVLAVYARGENLYHDAFNKAGAVVRNLNGDKFKVRGDGTFRDLETNDREVIFKAVQHSVQAMFDAYLALEKGKKVDDIAKAGSSYFAALKFLPIFIEEDTNQHFKGMWVTAAHDVANIAGVKLKVPEDKCKVPDLRGSDALWPRKQAEKCMEYPL